MIELKPIRETKEDYDEIERKIKELFKKEIYLPLLKEFAQTGTVLRNSLEDLLEALRRGRLTFSRGRISGQLNATLSKELRKLGAKWNRREKCYTVLKAELPLEVRAVIAASEFQFIEKIRRIDDKLSSILPEQLADKLKIEHLFDRTLWKVDRDFKQSVKKITIAPQLTKENRERIAAEWQNNMKLWIKKFTEEQIIKLRKDMNKTIFAGNRYESAIQSIHDSYEVTAKKAKFLARQETSLLMTKFKQVRYQDAGIHQYKWRSVLGTPHHPTRKRHKYLSDQSAKGVIFRFDNPPNTTEMEGKDTRPLFQGPANGFNNPGEDFNCRCVSIPVVNFKKG